MLGIVLFVRIMFSTYWIHIKSVKVPPQSQKVHKPCPNLQHHIHNKKYTLGYKSHFPYLQNLFNNNSNSIGKKNKNLRLLYILQIKTHIVYVCNLHKCIYSLLSEDRSFFCPPPRIRDICRPLLNAWLKSIRVWNSDTNGNHARNATGVNKSNPMIISQYCARVLIDDHSPDLRKNGLKACDI